MRFFFPCKYKFALTVGCSRYSCVLYWILYFTDYWASGQSAQSWFPSLKSRQHKWEHIWLPGVAELKIQLYWKAQILSVSSGRTCCSSLKHGPSRATTIERDASSLGCFDYKSDSLQQKGTEMAGAGNTLRLNEWSLAESTEPFLKKTADFYPSLAVKLEYDIYSASLHSIPMSFPIRKDIFLLLTSESWEHWPSFCCKPFPKTPMYLTYPCVTFFFLISSNRI